MTVDSISPSGSTSPASSGSSTSDGTPIFLGIDVGGSFVKMGLVDGGGKIHAQTSVATKILKTPEGVFEHAMKFARDRIEEGLGQPFSLSGVGLAVPGVLDTQTYRLREVVNLPGWVDRPLLEILVDKCRRPAAVVNDANAAAFAEHAKLGLGRRSLCLVTLGTGIGCGIVVNGYPHGGDHGCAGELGHMAIRFGQDAIPCSCGSCGHLESYAGAPGVLSRLRSAYALHTGSGGVPAWLNEDTTPRELADHANDGDLVCLRVIDNTASYLGQAIGLLGQIIDPAVVLLGGAMTFGGSGTELGTRFLNKVKRHIQKTTLVQVGKHMIVDFATMGNDAGIVGAALVAQQNARRESLSNTEAQLNP
ncbi:ROK family protein [Neorhodopirellula lusitana]|uniref:ROK family protein n=1 Tax=Neorhodopirellula lusitana TaxID=445327 RepID=UPI00384EBE40